MSLVEHNETFPVHRIQPGLAGGLRIPERHARGALGRNGSRTHLVHRGALSRIIYDQGLRLSQAEFISQPTLLQDHQWFGKQDCASTVLNGTSITKHTGNTQSSWVYQEPEEELVCWFFGSSQKMNESDNRKQNSLMMMSYD